MNLLQNAKELTKHNILFIMAEKKKLENYQASEAEIKEEVKKLKGSKILTDTERRQLATVACIAKQTEAYNILVIVPLSKKFNCDTWEARSIKQCAILGIADIINHTLSAEDKEKILTAAHNYTHATEQWNSCDRDDCNMYGSIMLRSQEEYDEVLNKIQEKHKLTKFNGYHDMNILATCLLEQESEGIRLQTM